MTAWLWSQGTASRSRGLSRPSFASLFPLHPQLKEGAGKAGSPLAPAVLRAGGTEERDARRHTGAAGTSRPSLRGGWNGLCRALLGERCTVAPVAVAALFDASARLDVAHHRTSLAPASRAPEPHDFAVRTSHRSSCAVRLAHGFPPCETSVAPMRPASTAVRPACRDDRDTPLFLGPGRGDVYALSEIR